MKLSLDEASLEIINQARHHIYVGIQSSECQRCSLQEVASIPVNQTASVAINTKYDTQIEVEISSGILCNLGYLGFVDQAKYQLKVAEKCQLLQLEGGRNNLWPMVALLSVVVLVISIARLKGHLTNRVTEEPLAAQEKPRIKSLDAFRGVVILLMVFVNNGGGGYKFFNHAPWFGYTVADVVFPSFLFIMGTSMALSIRSQVARMEGGSAKTLYLRILKRSIWLFFLGLVVNSIGETRLSHLRVPGVLQRFAVSYLVVASAHVFTLSKSTAPTTEVEQISRGLLQQFFNTARSSWLEWLIVSLCTLIYFGFTYLWKYSETCPRGYQGPGGLHDEEKFFNCTGGAARAIDVYVFGENHIYRRSTAQKIYLNTLSHDPEGLLGTATSILMVYLGLQAGKSINGQQNARTRLSRWLCWALASGQ